MEPSEYSGVALTDIGRHCNRRRDTHCMQIQPATAVALKAGKLLTIDYGLQAEHFVAANNAVGLCFTRKGDMIVATNESVYSLPLGITGTLLV